MNFKGFVPPPLPPRERDSGERPRWQRHVAGDGTAVGGAGGGDGFRGYPHTFVVLGPGAARVRGGEGGGDEGWGG